MKKIRSVVSCSLLSDKAGDWWTGLDIENEGGESKRLTCINVFRSRCIALFYRARKELKDRVGLL